MILTIIALLISIIGTVTFIKSEGFIAESDESEALEIWFPRTEKTVEVSYE